MSTNATRCAQPSKLPVEQFGWHLAIIAGRHGVATVARLRAHLQAQGLTQSRATVYRILTRTPGRLSLRLLRALCEALECTPNDLFLGVDPQLTTLPPPPRFFMRRRNQ